MHTRYNCARKNELLYPLGRYDEIPVIRDLAKKLSLEPNRNRDIQRPRAETRQTRQDNTRRKKRHGGHQQRDATASSFHVPPSSINDAHEVPRMIEIPASFSFSKDSEVSFEDCFKHNDSEDRDQSSIIPLQPNRFEFNKHYMHFDVHHQKHFVNDESELDCPSDEDDAYPRRDGRNERARKNCNLPLPTRLNR